jgi:Flp pilus assembly protein TadG
MPGNQRKDLGAIAVLGSVVLLVVGAFMALALNVGFIMNTRGQLQNSSDSAALASAGSIDRTDGQDLARQMALNYAGAHRVAEGPVTIDETPEGSDVTFGHWYFDTRTFVPTDDYLMIDAVKVVNGADGLGLHNKPLKTFFASLLGRPETSVPSAAVAIGRGARTDCPMPFALPSCLFMVGGAPLCGVQVTLKLSNAKDDNVGFMYLPVKECDKWGGNANIECNMRERCSGRCPPAC